jgi:hypothetical protein
VCVRVCFRTRYFVQMLGRHTARTVLQKLQVHLFIELGKGHSCCFVIRPLFIASNCNNSSTKAAGACKDKVLLGGD